MPGAIFNMIGFDPREYRNTAISFFLSAVPVIMITEFFKCCMIYIFLRCFCFLYANNIGGICFQPVEKAFIDRCTDAIDIVTNDTHRYYCLNWIAIYILLWKQLQNRRAASIIPSKEPVYLEGPKSRGYELAFAWRVFRQFIKGFRNLHFVGPCITVFGSARFKEDHPYYIKAREFGKRIAESGFTTMTGGGPGIMEAANRGAFENGGKSVGCNIQLPFEQTGKSVCAQVSNLRTFFCTKSVAGKIFLCIYHHARRIWYHG